MRIRIVVLMFALATVVIVLVLIPALDSVSRQRTSELNLERRTAIDRISRLAQVAIEDRDYRPLRRHVSRYHLLFGEEVLVVDWTGKQLASTGGLDPEEETIAKRLRDFGYNVPDVTLDSVTPWAEEKVLISAPVNVERDLASGAVLLEVNQRQARADVRRSWLGLLVPSMLMLAFLIFVANWAARWVLKPVLDMDHAIEAITSGHDPGQVLITGPPELRHLSRSFQAMTDAMTSTLAQQRDLVANTSHQLRNPLAAVRLRVDLLASEPLAHDDLIGPLQADLDRLAATVDRLLALAEADHLITTAAATQQSVVAGVDDFSSISGHEISAYLAQRWQFVTGVDLRVVGDLDLVLPLRPRAAREIVDSLVENAGKYAGRLPQVQVSVRRSDPHRVLLEVADNGNGLSPNEIAHAGTRFWRSEVHADLPGTGLGLALVSALARAAGGTMRVSDSDLGGLAVTLDLPDSRR